MSKYAALQHPTTSWSIFDFAAAALVAPVFQAAEIAGDLLNMRRAPRRTTAPHPLALLQPTRPQSRSSWRKRNLALG